jgi:Putative adhesin
MTDPVRHNPSLREIPVPAGGDVDLRLGSNRLNIRSGRDGVVVVRARDGEDLDRELEIITGHGYVKVVDGGAGTFRIGPLSLRSGHAPDLDVEVPRNVRLSVRTISGDVHAAAILGPSRWTTATGDLRLGLDGGPVTVETVSGDARIESAAPLAVTARTVSGDVRVRAPRVLVLDAATTSGDVEVDAALAETAVHTVTSLSGDVRLITGSEVRVETQSVAGDVKASMPHRTEGTRGRRTVVVGSGRVHVSVRTMSGDVQLRQGRPDDTGPAPAPAADPATASAPPPTWPAPSPAPTTTWPAPVTPASRPAPSAPPPAAPPVPVVTWPAAAPAGDAPTPAASIASAAAADPTPAAAPSTTAAVVDPAMAAIPSFADREPAPSPAEPPAAASAAMEDERLEILRALERGDLDVETAWHRLDALEPTGHPAATAW